MDITNYKKRSENYLEHILNNKYISDKNKKALKDFLNAYDVSPARETIFLSHIERILTLTDDIKRDMHDSKAISTIFKKMKDKYADATNDTIKAITMRFCRWLNNGKLPEGFKDIKRNRKDQLRELKPDDMISWEEGKLLANQSQSIQIKSAFLTQLDCGFRPSEFLNLNYGDVKLEGDIIIFSVRGGKTGDRLVFSYRAVPYFMLWYDNHPTKKKNDPLWIMENNKLSHRTANTKATSIERYSYSGLLKRFRILFDRAKIDKPRDFYNLRHSSCTLDKKDNVPLDEASARHGHSVKHFVETYGRLDISSTINRIRQHYGSAEERKVLLKNVKCERCKAINTQEAEYCQVCSVPLTAKTASKIYSESKELKKQVDEMQKMMKLILDKKDKFEQAKKKYKN